MMRRPFFLVAAVLAALLTAPAHAAGVHFFWAGFDVPAEAGLDRRTLEDALNPRFGATDTGALHRFLSTLALDDLDYWGAGEGALEVVGRRTSFDNVYGVYLSIDRLLRFEPIEREVAIPGSDPVVERQYFWYALGGLNVFSVDTKTLVYSRPVLLAPPHDDGFALQPPAVGAFVQEGLALFAARLEDRDDPFTDIMRRSLQTYLGDPGQDAAAARAPGAGSYGVVDVAPLQIGGSPPADERLSPAMRARLDDLARFHFSMQLSRFEPVTPVFEQQGKVSAAAEGVVVEGRRGHVAFDFDEGCQGGYRASGEYVFCVRVPAPRYRVRLAPRVDVHAEEAGRQYLGRVRFEIEEAPGGASPSPNSKAIGNAKPKAGSELRGRYATTSPRPPYRERLHDRPYGVALVNAIASLDRRRVEGRGER